MLGCPNLPQYAISEADCDEGQAGRSFSDEAVGTMFAACKDQVRRWLLAGAPWRGRPRCCMHDCRTAFHVVSQSRRPDQLLPLRTPAHALQGSWAGPVFGGMPSQRIFCNDTLPASQVRLGAGCCCRIPSRRGSR